MDLSDTVFETNSDFSRKSQIIPTYLRVFGALAEGVILGIGYRRRGGGQKTRMMGYRAE